MPINLSLPQAVELKPRIVVIGVGGAGGNAVNNMIDAGLDGVEFVVANTDAQALALSKADRRVQMGGGVTEGLGAGMRPEVGEQSAEESLHEIMEHIDGAHMLFVAAGMGGGTGTGAAPVIARAARERGVLTIGIVTKPFMFEGSRRMKLAEQGIENLYASVDTMITIPNQNLFRVATEQTTMSDAFAMADEVLHSGVRGVTDLMVVPGLINLDFNDVKTVMDEMGKAMMGTGEGEGDRRAIEAAEAAINNPLLDDVSMKGARGVIVNVSGGADMTLFEVDEACNRIRDEVDPNANIIFGSTFDEKLEGTMRVSVVATGIDMNESSRTIGGNGGGRTTSIPKLPAKEAPISAPKVATKTSYQSSLPQSEVARAMTIDARNEVKPMVSQAKPDMFQQQEFHAVQTNQAAVQVAPQVSPVHSFAQNQGQQPAQSAMRGQVYQGNFIPPIPIGPEPQDDVMYAPGVVQASVPAKPQRNFEQLQQTRSQEETASTEAQSNQGLVLHPPVPGAKASERRKAPSLLERITGVYGQVKNDITASREENAATRGNFHSGLRAEKAPENPSQGQLNIDAPSAPSKSNDEDLDIPAFLRRQAN